MAKAGPHQFLEFLKTKKSGDTVTTAEILSAVPAWTKSTLDTYRKKNKLISFVTPTEPTGSFLVVQDGSNVSEPEIKNALSQVAPRTIALARNDRLTGHFGEYTLLRELGAGAVGAVWRATSSTSDREVAVKVCSPRPDLLDPSVFGNVKDRFRRESRLGPRVSNDAVVRYLDYGDFRTTSFLVMELAQGSLRDTLALKGRLTSVEAAHIGQRVVGGLSWLHSQSCVHRDIKPANVLHTSRGAVIGDLGILRWGDLNPSFTSAGTITRSSIQLGSWYYMPPEQIEDPHHASPASDVFSLGITIYEMLTGAVPAPQRVAAGQLADASEFAALNSLIRRTTSFDAKSRPGLDEVANMLASVVTLAANG